MSYKRLIGKLLDVGIVRLQEHKPKIINGVFAVPKDENKQRLIIDARPANMLLKEPAKVTLPNPGNIALLHLEKKQELWFGKADMDNFYHRLRMPQWLHQYFGLPPIQYENKKLWPVVRVLPMGWSHSVFIGQAIHENIVCRAGLAVQDSFQQNKSRILKQFRHGGYIDDFFAFSTNKGYLQEVIEKVVSTCIGTRLPSKVEKLVLPGETSEINILGLLISLAGIVRPDLLKLRELIARTR